MNTIVKESVE